MSQCEIGGGRGAQAGARFFPSGGKSTNDRILALSRSDQPPTVSVSFQCLYLCLPFCAPANMACCTVLGFFFFKQQME